MKQSPITTPLHILSHNALLQTIKRKIIPYSTLITTSILKNKKTHLVTTFHEILKNTFLTEHIRKFYSHQQSKFRLKKLTTFYLIDTSIYPNYTRLPSAKYIYKNIIRKQFIRSKKEENAMLLQYKATHKDANLHEHIILNTMTYENIMNDTNSHLKSIFTCNSNYNDDITELNMLISKITNAENINRNKPTCLSSTTLCVGKGVSVIKPMLKVSRNINARCGNLKTISNSNYGDNTVESNCKSVKKLVLPKVQNVFSPVKFTNCKTISHRKYKSAVVNEDALGKERVDRKKEYLKLKNGNKKCNEDILRTKSFMTIKTQIKRNTVCNNNSNYCFGRKYNNGNSNNKISRNDNKKRIYLSIGKTYDLIK